jgi:hypothetical protein
MGTLNYAQWTVEFDDRLLTHLEIVIVNKFRRGEACLMSWLDSTAIGDGRSAIWLTPSVPAYFKFNGSCVPAIDDDWLHRLHASAGTSTGLIVTDESGRPARAGTPHSIGRTPRGSIGTLQTA